MVRGRTSRPLLDLSRNTGIFSNRWDVQTGAALHESQYHTGYNVRDTGNLVFACAVLMICLRFPI